MSTTRILQPSDWTAMGRLRVRCSTHAGGRVSQFTSAPFTNVPDSYKTRPNLAVGHFNDEGKLSAFICCYSNDGFWVLDLMVSSGNPKELHYCLDQCLAHYESVGIYQFFYAFPEKWARAYRSFWREGVDRLKKYTIEDVSIIEANKRSDPWIWEHVMHEYVAPVSLLLRKSYVKPAC